MEIERLHKMLLDAGIEHEWRDRTPDGWRDLCGKYPKLFNADRVWGWQVIVYKENGDRLVSAVEGWGTYGYSDESGLFGEPSDLIEIMGLLTPEEEREGVGGVIGWLTAEEVFRRIVEALKCMRS